MKKRQRISQQRQDFLLDTFFPMTKDIPLYELVQIGAFILNKYVGPSGSCYVAIYPIENFRKPNDTRIKILNIVEYGTATEG